MNRKTTLSAIADLATIDVPTAGSLLGLSRDSAYEAARRGEIPTLSFGRRLVVPVPRLMELIGANGAEEAS
ncbi:MAG: DNA-binding protein [Actinomycetota bacterium]